MSVERAHDPRNPLELRIQDVREEVVAKLRQQLRGGCRQAEVTADSEEKKLVGDRSGLEIQAAMAGGTELPKREAAVANAAGVPPQGRDDPGHVFCSFLALVLKKELERRLQAAGIELEWGDLMRDLDWLRETAVELQGKRFVVRSKAYGAVGKVVQCVGARLPATVRRVGKEESVPAPVQQSV